MEVAREFTFKFEVTYICTISQGFPIKREREEERKSYLTITVNAKNLRRATLKAHERMKYIISKQVKDWNEAKKPLYLIDSKHKVSQVKNLVSINHANYKLMGRVVSAGRNSQATTS